MLRILSLFVAKSLGALLHGPNSVGRNKVGVLEESLASKRSTKDPDRIENKTRTNLDERRR
jgi:hypothetical protein